MKFVLIHILVPFGRRQQEDFGLPLTRGLSSTAPFDMRSLASVSTLPEVGPIQVARGSGCEGFRTLNWTLKP